ncbi:MAG: hypothetical protein M1824_001680 [Vezdaea acicularis]|nr:MAG: hypothetical protein M1824_001680 [Vezdaea acicularis]
MDSSQSNGTVGQSGHPLDGWKDYPKNESWHDPDNPHRNLLAKRMGPYELGCIPNQFHILMIKGPPATEVAKVIENSQSLEELLLVSEFQLQSQQYAPRYLQA